ncbi:MAG: CRISPR-associated endonuclease Cas1, partial [Dechloromonas agitata]|nr:CRISPR-associated endonuclease Cas1 [Dechloromonas agitata]
MQLLNTLYVTLPESYVHLDNNTVRLEVEHETRLRVPLHHLGAVVCFGQVSVSLPLMHRLAEDGVALVLLDANGRFKARLEGAVSGNVLLRQAQYRLAGDPAFAIGV